MAMEVTYLYEGCSGLDLASTHASVLSPITVPCHGAFVLRSFWMIRPRPLGTPTSGPCKAPSWVSA
eukprot:13747440-Alexandrium_andersonii.AAC.1